MASTKVTGKLTEEQFTIKAIEQLRKGSYLGIHTVYSGFNEAFRKYFGDGASPVITTKKLADEGKVVIRFARGGAMLYKAGEEPVTKPKGDEALAKIIG